MGCEGIEPLVTTSTFHDAGFTNRHKEAVSDSPEVTYRNDDGPHTLRLPSPGGAGDLELVADAWDTLPEHVRLAILALAGVPPATAGGGEARRSGRPRQRG